MNVDLVLDPEREANVRTRLTEHFTRLGYPDIASAVHWSLSLDGAALRFRYVTPFLGAGLGPEVADALRPRLLVSGMGSGSEMIAARRLGFGAIHGTEVDAFYVPLVTERLAGNPGFFPMLVDGVRTPYAESSFDVVVSGHIVEHTSDPASYVSEHLRLVKPGGFLLLEFPTRFHTRELHTGLPSLEWLPERLRTGILSGIARKKGIGALGFSEETRRRCRAIVDTGLKQVSLGRVRRWVKDSGVEAKLVTQGRPAPGVVYGLFQRAPEGVR